MEKYHVLKDTREQTGWNFIKSDNCNGMTIATLKTGDYTLRGLEDVFIIERKATTAEWAKNLLEARFERELERLDAFPFSWLIMEFSMSDIMAFPNGSGIPKNRWKYLKMKPDFILKRTLDLQAKFKTKFVFTGLFGQRFASSLFKRASETYGIDKKE